MLDVLAVTTPFFALVACGYTATRLGWLPVSSIGGLNTFVLYFALPCMLYRLCAASPVSQWLNGAVAGVYLLCGLCMVAFAVATTLRGRVGWNDAAFGALVAAFPNTGFMGVPLITALLGPQQVSTVVVLIVLDMVVTSSLCIGLSRLDGASGPGASAAMRKALAGMLKNPMPWAIAVGTVMSMLVWGLPKPVQHTVDLLANAASPVALFTLGAVLARAQMTAPVEAQPAVGSVPTPHPDDAVLWVAGLKLLLHPVLVGVCGLLALRWGWGLSTQALTVMVLVAALPSASNVTLLAERFQANTGRIARIILCTTAASFFTFSAAVVLVVGRF